MRRIPGPLHREHGVALSSAPQLATWPSGLGNGLQSRVHEFDSHRRLQPLSEQCSLRGSSRLGMIRRFPVAVVFLAVSDEDDDGNIDLDVPSVEVDG